MTLNQLRAKTSRGDAGRVTEGTVGTTSTNVGPGFKQFSHDDRR